MAKMHNHEVVETYRSVLSPDHLFHVTKNDRIIRTTGPRGGGAKVLMVTEDGKFFFGLGRPNSRRATATEYRGRLAKMERVS